MTSRIIKKPDEIKTLEAGGKILAGILQTLVERSVVGVSTEELDQLAESLIRKHGGRPAFKHYQSDKNDPPFPSTICASVNDQLVHTPASSYRLRDGDIFSIDIGMQYPATPQGLFTDMAVSIAIGTPSPLVEKLIAVVRESLYRGIQQVRPGNHISDISRAVQSYVESEGFSVIRQLVGHGVGYQVHEEPKVPNYLDRRTADVELRSGMVLAIEPMISAGDYLVTVLPDGWTMAMADGSLCAHYEHTVAVTDRGYHILTEI